MLIKSFVTGAALALAISAGSASAAEDFSTMSAVPAEPLTASQMADVVGAYAIGIDPAGAVLFTEFHNLTCVHDAIELEWSAKVLSAQQEWDAKLVEMQQERDAKMRQFELEGKGEWLEKQGAWDAKVLEIQQEGIAKVLEIQLKGTSEILLMFHHG